MTAAATGAKPYYFIPQPSHWPITGAIALLFMGTGAAFWFNGYPAGPWLSGTGFVILLYMLFGWFGTVIGESQHHLYNKKVDASFRWSMSWFIFSEVMFFAAFFGALFYIRNLSIPELGTIGSATRDYLWPNYAAQWPTEGPYIRRSSRRWAHSASRRSTRQSADFGITLTIAHHGLKAGHRGVLEILAVPHDRAGLHVPGLPGVGTTMPTPRWASNSRAACTARPSTC